jgi:hypothetical protein
MWSTVTPQPLDAAAPSSRAKHSATLLGGHLYLLGGRNGNVGLKDFWRYSIGEKPQIILNYLKILVVNFVNNLAQA